MKPKVWIAWPLILLLIGVVLTVGCSKSSPAGISKDTLITVSMQPTFHGLPTYMAMQKGWDKTDGLKLETQLYLSGPPQNEALASNTWEVGAEGAVPGMLAAIRYGAYIIAVADDDSDANTLWARPNSSILKTKGLNPKFPDVYGSAATVKGKTILLTTASNGHYAVVATLKALGVSEQDVKLVHMEPPQILPALESGRGDIAQLWTPFDYAAEAKGFKEISSGKRAGINILCLVLATKKAFEENPEKVAKWLKVYMKGVAEMKANPTESTKMLGAFYKENGVTLGDESLAQEFPRRTLYDTKEQLALFAKKNGAPSQVEQWMSDLAGFFVQQGRITVVEKEKLMTGNYMNDKILKMVAH
jgi:NitT/TauT family transport system substrate-binding protein/sulfonate transport system substrate-binding protein